MGSKIKQKLTRGRNLVQKKYFYIKNGVIAFLSRDNEWIFTNQSDATYGFFRAQNSVRCPMSASTKWFWAHDGIWEETTKISDNPSIRKFGKCECAQNGLHYTGSQNMTISGFVCQNWNAKSPHVPSFRPKISDHNFCRTPGNFFFQNFD